MEVGEEKFSSPRHLKNKANLPNAQHPHKHQTGGTLFAEERKAWLRVSRQEKRACTYTITQAREKT